MQIAMGKGLLCIDLLEYYFSAALSFSEGVQ